MSEAKRPRPRTPIAATAIAAIFTLLGAVSASQAQLATQPTQAPVVRDGSHDFDWDIGAWKTHQRRLLHPLTGSTTWVEYTGTDVVRRLWDGADSAMIEAEGPAGRIEIFALRLYNPDAHQWSINFASRTAGAMGLPSVGEFKDGRGDFFDQESFGGRAIWCASASPTSPRHRAISNRPSPPTAARPGR